MEQEIGDEDMAVGVERAHNNTNEKQNQPHRLVLKTSNRVALQPLLYLAASLARVPIMSVATLFGTSA